MQTAASLVVKPKGDQPIQRKRSASATIGPRNEARQLHTVVGCSVFEARYCACKMPYHTNGISRYFNFVDDPPDAPMHHRGISANTPQPRYSRV